MVLVEGNRPKPVFLCILDGWGYREAKSNNAIEMGETPVWHHMFKDYPHTLVKTSGLSVGLPEGQMGNSEVGHTNIGAGRVVMQDLPKISLAIEDGSFATQEALISFIDKLKESKGSCHLLGLMSKGGVHSHQDHILAAAKVLSRNGIRVSVHAFLDGRDTPPDSGKSFIKEFMKEIKEEENIHIATIGGRYYGMDRDNRWDREKLAYDAIVSGEGPRFVSALDAIEASYSEKVYDEFVVPAVIGDYQGMKDGDGLFMTNFRADRARQILLALLSPDFKGFERKRIKFSGTLGMVEYSSELGKLMDTVFPPEDLNKVFGEVVSEEGLSQLRIAETEKYAHVTFFFNGGQEKKFLGEDRILIPSPKVSTYDLKPEMSAFEVTDKIIEAIESKKYDVIIANFANGDMVGHTGFLEAAIKAVEAVDKCLGRIEEALIKTGGVMFLTADHGNCEMMLDEKTHSPYTAHTTFDVPAILVNPPANIKALAGGGKLADIAPTLLDLLGIKKPLEMTGHSLLIKD